MVLAPFLTAAASSTRRTRPQLTRAPTQQHATAARFMIPIERGTVPLVLLRVLVLFFFTLKFTSAVLDALARGVSGPLSAFGGGAPPPSAVGHAPPALVYRALPRHALLFVVFFF